MEMPFERDLRAVVEGEVRFDQQSKTIYSVDASIYEIEPIGIVVPRSRQDLVAAIQIANKHAVPVIARGAATGIAGGCIGRGLIIDTTQHLNHILEINLEEEYVRCEPGVVQDELNDALSDAGYRLGPDTSTGNRATIGGMIGNNAAGARSLRYGKMVDHVLEMDLILANGEEIHIGPLTKEEWALKSSLDGQEGEIYRTIDAIRQSSSEKIQNKFPNIPRRVSGYNLDELLRNDPVNLCKLIVGSEGSLAVVSTVKLRICKKPQTTGLCILHFEHMIRALEQVPWLLEFQPLSLELIDAEIIKMGRLSPSMRDKLDWLHGDPAAIFVVEFDAPSREDLKSKIRALETAVDEKKISYAHSHVLDPEPMLHVWALRKAGLGLLLSRRTYSRAIGFLEDISVGPDELAAFMDKFLAYLSKHNKKAGVYGHIGSGCMHVRPFINLRKEDDVQLMHKMMLDIADMLIIHNGSLSGEHGDGLVRSWLNRRMFGDAVYRCFCELKAAFDPDNRMNPGKVVHAPELLNDLRMTPSVQQVEIPTMFDYSREKGIELAVDMCNGNAQCRKKEGLMCPSFQAYGDERHSTRARAQSLRAIINGRVNSDTFSSPELHEILDYCLECKGCKTECPSQVDMAKLKAEFLYHYQAKHGYSLRSRLFANIPSINYLASYAPRLFNWLANRGINKKILSGLGIHPSRSLPSFAPQTFSRWLQSQERQTNKKKVVLYNDTYTQFNVPQIGIAAFRLLEAMGYEVIVPAWQCCGRPLISKGFLDKAKKRAQALTDTLYPFAKQGIPIIGLEPSCILTIKDDFRDLLSGNQRQQVVDSVVTLDEFLNKHVDDGSFQLNFKKTDSEIYLHGHCHQKSLVGMNPTLNVLRSIPGFHVHHIPSGCCGLAGSFGHESEHYDMSMAIAENTLAPTIRQTSNDALIVASGYSCRSQIEHSTGRRALHLGELLMQQLRI